MYEEKLAKTIVDRINATHDVVACSDLFALLREWEGVSATISDNLLSYNSHER